MKKYTLILALLILPVLCFSQTNWTSEKYNYSIEIPDGFSEATGVGSNVDFKAMKGISSIVIVVKVLPKEYVSYSIWDLLGDLETFGGEWEGGAKEYFNNPKFIKYGKTTISNLSTFWFDYTTDNPKFYTKNYQFKKGNKLYTVTLTCSKSEYNFYSAIWFRFKNNIKIK